MSSDISSDWLCIKDWPTIQYEVWDHPPSQPNSKYSEEDSAIDQADQMISPKTIEH